MMRNIKLLSVLLLCMAVVFTSCGTWNNTAKGTAIGVGGGAAVGAGVGALAEIPHWVRDWCGRRWYSRCVNR